MYMFVSVDDCDSKDPKMPYNKVVSKVEIFYKKKATEMLTEWFFLLEVEASLHSETECVMFLFCLINSDFLSSLVFM